MSQTPLELLFGPHLKNAPLTDSTAGAGQFAGRTTLASGSSSVTVSTAMVNSNSIILAMSEVGSVGANSGGALVVNSIVSGTSFALARSTANAVAWDDTVMWLLLRTT